MEAKVILPLCPVCKKGVVREYEVKSRTATYSGVGRSYPELRHIDTGTLIQGCTLEY